MWQKLKPQAGNLRLWQGGLLLALLALLAFPWINPTSPIFTFN